MIETHAHMVSNFVKVGDRVKAYETVIGTIGTGNGQWYAHDHVSFSKHLSTKEIKRYIFGWDKARVAKYYLNPHELGIEWARMYNIDVNVGRSGYDFLQSIEGKGWHPGVDINGNGGGNTDKGAEIRPAFDGVVVYEKRTWRKNGGWGNLIMIECDSKDKPTNIQPKTQDVHSSDQGDKIKELEATVERRNKTLDEIYKLAKKK